MTARHLRSSFELGLWRDPTLHSRDGVDADPIETQKAETEFRNGQSGVRTLARLNRFAIAGLRRVRASISVKGLQRCHELERTIYVLATPLSRARTGHSGALQAGQA